MLPRFLPIAQLSTEGSNALRTIVGGGRCWIPWLRELLAGSSCSRGTTASFSAEACSPTRAALSPGLPERFRTRTPAGSTGQRMAYVSLRAPMSTPTGRVSRCFGLDLGWLDGRSWLLMLMATLPRRSLGWFLSMRDPARSRETGKTSLSSCSQETPYWGGRITVHVDCEGTLGCAYALPNSDWSKE